MNPFDIAVLLVAAVAVITGYRAGLIRSAATILGYIAALPIAVAASAFVAPAFGASRTAIPGTQNALVFFLLFLASGMAVSAGLRLVINETIGPKVGIADSLMGSMLGAVRVGLIAMSLVLVFDRIIPAGREPAFLVGSQLRPMLSATAARGLRALPPETAAYIDKLKQDNMRGVRSL